MALNLIKSQQSTEGRLFTSVQDKFSRIDKWLLRKIYQSLGRPPIRLMLGNGPEVSRMDALPVARMVIHDRRTLLDLILDPEVGFGDAYSDGRITVEGVFARKACQRIPATRAHLYREELCEGQEVSTSSDSDSLSVHLGVARG